MESRDIYIKLTDPTGKHKPEDRRTVTEATRAEYQAGR